jgi:hypothetical protein
MTDDRRGLLTDREREILLSGGKEVSDEYYSVVVSRVRNKIQRLATDIEALQQHPTLYDELLEEIPDRQRPDSRTHTDDTDTDLDSMLSAEDSGDHSSAK